MSKPEELTTGTEQEPKEDVLATDKEREPGADQLADQLEEAVEEAGGKERLIRRFGTVEVKLSKSFEWCGKTYEEINMNFEGLTGRDMEAIDDEIGVMGLRGLVPAYSRMYQRMLAARASGVPSDVIDHLPLVDYNAIVTAAQNFLFVTG